MRYTTVLACVIVSAAAALTGEPAVAQITHQGQHVSDHVVLRDGSLSGRFESVCPAASFKGRGLFRVLPDGTSASEPFVVPAGRQLVITDVEWTVDSLSTGGPLTAGGSVRTRLRIGSGTTFDAVFLSRTVLVGSERGAVSASEQLTAGFLVAPNTAICPIATEFGPNLVRSARVVEIVLRGYLISSH